MAAAITAEAAAAYERATDEFVRTYNDEARRIMELERTDNRAAADRHVALGSIVARYMMTYGRQITNQVDMLFLRNEIVSRCMQAVVLHSMQLSGFADLAMSLGAVREIRGDIERARRRLENARDNDDGGGGEDGGDDDSTDPRVHTGGLYEYIPYEKLEVTSLVGLRGYAQQHRMLTNAYFVIDGDPFDGRMVDETAERKPRTKAGANVILHGPPGTGKTVAAMGVAKHLRLNVAFVNAENLVSAYRSETEKNLRKLYQRMRSLVRATGRDVVLLLDEVDGLVKNRSSSCGMTSGEYSLLTRFLTILEPNDGTDNYGIFSIFTTNRLSNLDDAFRRRCTAIFMGRVDTDDSLVQLFNGILHNAIDYSSRSFGNYDADIARTCHDWVPGDFTRFKRTVVEPLQLYRYFQQRNTTYNDFIAARLAAEEEAAGDGDDGDRRRLRFDLPLLPYSELLARAAEYVPITPKRVYEAEYAAAAAK